MFYSGTMIISFLYFVFRHPFIALGTWLAFSTVAALLAGKMIRWGTQ